MAVVGSNLTSGSDTDGGSGSTTASVSPASNNLILLTVNSRTGITADPNQPTATGNGLTWVVVNSVVYDTTSASRRRITVFRAMGASPSAGAISIDFGGQNQTTVQWSVDQFSGVDTSGTNGSGAVVQSATNLDESATNTTFTVTLAAFGSVDNATFGGMATTGADDITVGSGFTGLAIIETVADINTATEWKATNDTSVDITTAVESVFGGVALEIKAAVVVAGGPPVGTLRLLGVGR